MNQNIFFLFLLLLCSTISGMENPGNFILSFLNNECRKSIEVYMASNKNTQTIIDIFALDETEILSPEEILFYENMRTIRTLLQLNRKFFKEINSFYKNSILQYNCHINHSFFAVNFASHFDSIYKKACANSSIDHFYIELIAKDFATNHKDMLTLILCRYAASNHITRLCGSSRLNIGKRYLSEAKIKKGTYPLVYLLNRILYFKNTKQIILQSENQIILPSYLQTLSLEYDIHIAEHISLISQTKIFHTTITANDKDDFGMNPTICTIL